MDTEAGGVDSSLDSKRLASLSCHKVDTTHSVSTDDLALHVDLDHVAHFHETKVTGKTENPDQYRFSSTGRASHSRVNPKSVRIDRVPNTYMTCSSFPIALSRHDPEGAGHAFQGPFSLVIWIGESRDTLHGSTSSYG